MSLMVAAMKLRVGNPLRKLVLIKLADNASDMGECWPSYQHIADQCEIDRSTVRKHIKHLEMQGLVRIENREGPKGNSSNLYRITLCRPVGPNSTPVGPESTGVGPQPTGGVGPESTRTSHSFEPVTEPDSLSARGQFISEAAKRRIGISPNGEIPFPPAFKPSADHIAIASEKGINIETELLNFRDYHQARGTKLIDWNSAFRVWLRNARVNPLSGRQRSEPDSPHWNSPEGWKDFI